MAIAPIQELLAELHRRGVELVAQGSRLRFRPVDAVSPELLARIRAHKVEILAELRRPDVPAPPRPPEPSRARDLLERALAAPVEPARQNPPHSPIALLDAAWIRAEAKAHEGFDQAGTEPDPDTLSAAIWLLLDTDPNAPEGERSYFRQHGSYFNPHDAAETVQLALQELYRGIAIAQRQPDGTIVVRSAALPKRPAEVDHTRTKE